MTFIFVCTMESERHFFIAFLTRIFVGRSNTSKICVTISNIFGIFVVGSMIIEKVRKIPPFSPRYINNSDGIYFYFFLIISKDLWHETGALWFCFREREIIIPPQVKPYVTFINKYVTKENVYK